MQKGLQAGATRQGLAAGSTRGGLKAGASKTGRIGGTTRRFTRGTTTQSATDAFWIQKNAMDQEVDVTPIPIYPWRQAQIAKPKAGAGGQTSSKIAAGNTETASEADRERATESKQSEGEQQKLKQPAAKAKPDEQSMQSQGLTSSLADTSEDEEAKKKEAEKKAKKAKKGLSSKELEMDVDIELKETETQFFLHIPSVKLPHESPDYEKVIEANKAYDTLLAGKIGSDNYAPRGSQTTNLTLKTREIAQKGFTQENKDMQASFWDIYDSSKQRIISEDEQLETEYKKFVEEQLAVRIKEQGCLIDAEAFASGLPMKGQGGSKVGASGVAGSGVNKSGAGSQKSKGSKGGKGSSKEKSSGSNLKASSVSQSATSDLNSGTEMSQSETNQRSSAVGDYGVPKKVEYDREAVLPDTIMTAIKIIERLLTQSKFHEQHVAYRNYPPVNLEKGKIEDDEDEGQKKGWGIRRGKEKEEKVEEKKDEEELKEGEVRLNSLFTFECDVTAGRQVSCIDINEVNADLVAVSYGEPDINCTNEEQLKCGLLCFWTLKNPNFPEKIIRTERSITCCQFSKWNPHLIACGDSHGNIMIYNVKDDTNEPMVQSRDLDGRHTEIIWELQWVTRENKGEFLISISGDGRIIEWSMKKGLELNELKQLKRYTNPNQKDVYAGAETEKKNTGMTFIETGGLSFDFPRGGATGDNYFVATEDCTIHRCRISLSAQYLENYFGHAGPIYKIRCNPYWQNTECPIFLTCSYDWTVRVWHEEDKTPKLVCHQLSGDNTLRAQVNDICWSPQTSSVFGSVANDGRIEIWDLKRNSLQPQLTHFDGMKPGEELDNTPRTVIKFSKSSPVVFTGNLKGQVGVYRCLGLEHEQVTEQDQINRIMTAIAKDDFVSDTKDKKQEDDE